MKKICLGLFGLYIGIFGAFSQKRDTIATTNDSANYKSRKLKVEEINLVSSYYRQDGSNSAVEGGIGSERLSDIANVIDVKLMKYDKKQRKHSFTAEVGVDHYTSASSDKIDLKANSSASSADTRIYPSLSWNMENEKKGSNYGLSVSASSEFDYKSTGFAANLNQRSKDGNREFGIKAQAFLDKVSLVLPVELRTNDHYQQVARNSYSATLTLSQVINKRLQVLLDVDVVKQSGFLSLPFHRVYFADNATVRTERLPSSRLKIPIGIRANYFLGDKIVLRSFYRFYRDDWGLTAHTADLESSYKFTPFLSLTGFYRFYTQSGVDYFAGWKMHTAGENYYTSNYDLSSFNSHFFGAGIRFAAPNAVFGIKHWRVVELRYGHYTRSTSMNADVLSLNLTFK